MSTIKTRLQLEKQIELSRGEICNRVYDYITLILDLEQSILYNRDINQKFIMEIYKLDFFQDLAIYNIYNKILSLITHKKNNYKIYGSANNLVKILVLDDPIFELEFSKNIKLNLYNSEITKDLVLNQERLYIKEKILETNNLEEEKDFENYSDKKVKKYGFADIIIK